LNDRIAEIEFATMPHASAIADTCRQRSSGLGGLHLCQEIPGFLQQRVQIIDRA
jgi:hypothetical protein